LSDRRNGPGLNSQALKPIPVRNAELVKTRATNDPDPALVYVTTVAVAAARARREGTIRKRTLEPSTAHAATNIAVGPSTAAAIVACELRVSRDEAESATMVRIKIRPAAKTMTLPFPATTLLGRGYADINDFGRDSSLPS
jgi:hypothetical protein